MFTFLPIKRLFVIDQPRSIMLYNNSTKKFFSEIYIPDVNWYTYRKIDVYDMICKKYNLLPNEICVIGDDYIVDLEDACGKGYMCVLINNVCNKEIKSIQNINSLLKIIENES